MFAMMIQQWCEAAGMPVDCDDPCNRRKTGAYWVIMFALRSTNIKRWELYTKGVFGDL